MVPMGKAKGGYDDGIHNGRCRMDKSCAGSIAAHPFDKLRSGSCKKRKHGAPSVGTAQCKDGPPARVSEGFTTIRQAATDRTGL
jgi:hypothetical protein